MDQTTEQFEALCERAWELQKEKDALALHEKKINEELEPLKAKIIEHLEFFEKTRHDTKHGAFILSRKTSVKLPDDKREFYQYLKDKNIFEDMVTVHSNTLNAWYKQEMEAAIERKDADFKIPGLGLPTTYTTVSLRKK